MKKMALVLCVVLSLTQIVFFAGCKKSDGNAGSSGKATDNDVNEAETVNQDDTNTGKKTYTSVNGIQDMIDSGKVEGDFYLFFTDPHIGPVTEDGEIAPIHWEGLSDFGNLYEMSRASFAICGGDWLNDTNNKKGAMNLLSEVRTNMTKIFGKNSYLVVGNHDYNYQYRTGDGVIGASKYKLTPSEIAKAWNMENGKPYYSFNSNASRYYVFDSGIEWGHDTCDDYDNEQLKWYIQSLDANDDAHIVLVTHGILPVSTEAARIAAAYDAGETYEFDGKVYDFSKKTGMVEYMIAGHEHGDRIGELSGIPYVLTTAYNLYANTVDFVFADYTDRQLYLIRVGDGESRTIDLIAKK